LNLLLDLDGTLTNPREGIVACIQHALRSMGLAIPEADWLERFIGPPLREAFHELLPAEASADSVETAVAFYRERFSTVGLFENSVYPGISDSLEAARTQGNRLFLATSKPRVYAIEILGHFGLLDFFEGVYGSELDGRNSDKSSLIRFVLSDAHLSANDTVMIGDRHHDMTGADANSVFPVGVLWGFGSEPELTQAGARRLLSQTDELGSLTLLLAPGTS
jgi:phosphoglycolate phosphatase